ncbi:MAG: dihydroorotate dehydrogenase [Treponemataceae bacterium]|nr:dihydroorotate dehydrogenase [Treponemataceae bacterium]
MSGFSDCSKNTIPVFCEAQVENCESIKEAFPSGSVFSLTVKFAAQENSIPSPGQFFMLRAKHSQVLLARPISVFNAIPDTRMGYIQVEFLILKKGQGTSELCALQKGDFLELLGPCGNVFPSPDKNEKVCIAGGGIGIAPVAGFAKNLPPKSYDFYASFKSGSYGIENVSPENLVVTTNDGSCGIRGMISAALTAQVLKEKKYSVVYACGPEPMLRYIQKICAEAGTKCFLSLESKMACGMGACLGCTIKTKGGLKRCCKDGPVFEASEIIFDEKEFAKAKPPLEKVDLSVKIFSRSSHKTSGAKKELFLKNPVIAASGTFGFGAEYKNIFDVASLGAIASKGLTLEAREGNSGARIWETPSGLMNSIGLQNPGIPHFVREEFPAMKKIGTSVIANLSGSTAESYEEGARLLEKTEVDAIELNISCPNVSKGGAAFGMTCEDAGGITRRIREIVSKPLIVKLTPQASDVAAVAMSCVAAGADAISLCNSFQGVAIDIEKARPVFEKIKAGFGGPAIRPIALRLVYEVFLEMKKLPQENRVPIIGIGGIATWRDAVEFIMAGASAVQVGTATFANPFAMIQIVEGLEEFMKRKGYASVEEMRGAAV